MLARMDPRPDRFFRTVIYSYLLMPILAAEALYLFGGFILGFFASPVFLEMWRYFYVARVIGMLFGVATIPLLYLVGKELPDQRVGLLAALFLTFYPTHVVRSQEGTPYTAQLFFALLSLFSLFPGCANAGKRATTCWRGSVPVSRPPSSTMFFSSSCPFALPTSCMEPGEDTGSDGSFWASHSTWGCCRWASASWLGILGLSGAELRERFDDIVDSAELRQFIDVPVKRYSSGIYARLGFAVAAHTDPDILLVDEVLSVGDARFQMRCFKRMQEFLRQGKTLIFVSHNLYAIVTICARVLLLNQS